MGNLRNGVDHDKREENAGYCLSDMCKDSLRAVSQVAMAELQKGNDGGEKWT